MPKQEKAYLATLTEKAFRMGTFIYSVPVPASTPPMRKQVIV